MRKEVENILKILIEYIYTYRGMFGITDIHISILYILYGIHKKYSIKEEDSFIRFICEEDKLLKDFIEYHKKYRAYYNFPYLRLYNQLIKHDSDIDTYYKKIICRINEEVSELFSQGDERYTPTEIAKLVSYFINKTKCDSLFDPFCGTSNIIHYLNTQDKQVVFIGAEYDNGASLISRVNVESRICSGNTIWHGNSFKEWLKRPFDVVYSCPPYDLYITQPKNLISTGIYSSKQKTYEELFYNNAITYNDAKLIISLEPLAFSFRKKDYNIRKDLIEKNLLDTVVSLPANLLYGTKMSSLLIVCKTGRKEGEPITFIHANELYIGELNTQCRFDIEKFEEIVNTKNPDLCVEVKQEKVRNYKYNLNPCLYRNRELKPSESQKVYKLGDIIKKVKTIKEDDDFVPCGYIKAELTSNSFTQIMLNMNKTSIQDIDQFLNPHPSFAPEQGKSYLIVYENRGIINYYIYTLPDRFYCSKGLKVFSIDNNLVDPRYLAHLLSTPAITNSHLGFTFFLESSFIIESLELQDDLVQRAIEEHAKKAKEGRRGDKQRVSDLEHMLGSTQIKISSIISCLEAITPENYNYSCMIKQLKDNFEYMNRIIRYSSSSIEDNKFNSKDCKITDLINEYLESWKNYGGYCFRISCSNKINRDAIVTVDKMLITVMIDSILSNAIRHGFHKRKDYTPDNQVQICLTEELFDGKAYVVLRIANNGDKIDDQITIYDYIKKGKYSSSTGRSGLGGYHVYQIVKRHNGYLYLDSNKEWNTIVEILLPSDNSVLCNLIKYEHECV